MIRRKKATALYLMYFDKQILKDLNNERKSESDKLIRFCKYDDWYQQIIFYNSVS